MKTTISWVTSIKKSLWLSFALLFCTQLVSAQCATPVTTISENFASGIPQCWSVYATQFYGSVGTQGQAVHMTTDNNQYTNAVAYLVTPMVQNCRGQLSFYAERGFPPFVGTAIQVGVMSSPTDYNSFTLMGTYNAPYTTGITINLDMSSYLGNYQYIAFKLVEPGSGTNKMILDNINYVSGCESNSVTAIAQNITAQLSNTGSLVVSPSAVNNGSTSGCGAPTLSLSKTSFNCSDVGSNAVVLTATDNSGNVSTANATITVLPAITDETVTAGTTNLCTTGSTTISTGASVNGIKYYLRDDANNAIIDGPITGNGSAVNFNTGTISSTTTYNVYAETVGIPNPPIGLTFDGANDFVSMPCESSFNYAAGYTIEGWVNAPNSGSNSRAYFFAGTNAVSDIEIYAQGSSNQIFVVHNRGKGAITSSGRGFPVPPANTWFHLAITYDGTTIRAFYNGIEQTPTSTIAGSALTKSVGAELTMGYVKSMTNNPSWGFSTFLGKLDDVRYWNSARSGAQILANKDNCLAGNEAGLVSYYNLDDATGATAVDNATSNNGTLINMTPNANWVTGNVSCQFTGDPTCYRELTQTVTITVGTDNLAPVPTLASLSSINAQCSVTSLTTPTAADNCAGIINGTHNATLPITAPGTTVVTWTYDDGNGNIATQTQNVVINDNTMPVPTLASLPSINAQCSVTNLTAPTATDNCAGTLTGTHNVTLPISTSGTTVVTWTYNDGNGNSATQTQNVVINDNTAPVPTLASLPTITNQCSVANLTTPTANDNCSGVINGTHNAIFPITTPGTTVVTWTFTDGNGNQSSQTQNVVINDNTLPVATNATLSALTDECSIASLVAPTATDNCAGMLTGTHNVTLPLTTSTMITWTYDDGNGNILTQTQDVIINDVSAPVADLASLANLTDECAITSLVAPTATDNCAGTLSGTHNVTLPLTSSTTITWTFDDGNGNSITQNQDVIINDVTAPVANVATLATVISECAIISIPAPTATDNCVGVITATHNTVFPLTTSTTITWTYDDGNGNITTQTQEVEIEDISAPVPDVAALPEIVATCSVNSLIPPTATDNCSSTVITGVHNVSLPITSTVTITWTFTDNDGNLSTQDQVVTINPIDVSLSVSDNVISANNSNATSYQWFDCNNGNTAIVGATSATFTPTNNGSYGVTITENGCTESSACEIISSIGVDEMSIATINIYPNPAKDVITLATDLNIESTTVFDISGNVIGTFSGTNYNVAHLTPGVYFLSVSTSRGLVQHKFVKQ